MRRAISTSNPVSSPFSSTKPNGGVSLVTPTITLPRAMTLSSTDSSAASTLADCIAANIRRENETIVRVSLPNIPVSPMCRFVPNFSDSRTLLLACHHRFGLVAVSRNGPDSVPAQPGTPTAAVPAEAGIHTALTEHECAEGGLGFRWGSGRVLAIVERSWHDSRLENVKPCE